MAKVKKMSTREDTRRHAPATTPEARENEMIALAYDAAEERIRNGTASAQEICYFLKMGSTNNRLEREIMEKQKGLMDAKIKAYQSADELKELYGEAIAAMKHYAGLDNDEDI